MKLMSLIMCAENKYFNQERKMKKLVCAGATIAMLVGGAAANAGVSGGGKAGVSGGGKVSILGVSGGGKASILGVSGGGKSGVSGGG